MKIIIVIVMVIVIAMDVYDVFLTCVAGKVSGGLSGFSPPGARTNPRR